MPWDDLIRAANKAEARAKIQESTHLDQRCPKKRRSLKMSLNSRDNQAESKATAPQTKAHSLPAGQLEVSRRAWREKKQMRRGRQGHREASPAKSQEDISKTDASKADAS